MAQFKPYRPLSLGDRVKVVQQSAHPKVKSRFYRVVGLNAQYDLVKLEWIDARSGSEEQYILVPADFVRIC